jgi:Cu+-exporting ATPase
MGNNETLEKQDFRPVTELAVSGMTCSNCARHVTEAIQSVAGVKSATVNLEQSKASVRWVASGQRAVAAVIGAVQDAGYEASEIKAATQGHDCDHDHVERRLAGWQLNLWIGVLGMVPLMVGEWVFGLGTARWFQWFSFGLAGVVQVFSGASFYRGAWRQLKVGSSNMDTLVALGSTTAFAYSVWALFGGLPGHVYFMESASIITLVSVGHWLESRVSARASSALQKLLNLAPSTARRRGADGSEREVAVADLKLGDLVALRPGDRVPTDGEVVEGESSVDEAMLTGESAPVDKAGGARLYAGTVNLNGRLVMRVVATGEETALAHIIEAVQRAQSSRADIQRLGDRVSSVFVPVVATVALAAGLWWGLAPESAREAHGWLAQFLWHAHPPEGRAAAAFIIAAGVLIIACPCAMGLATPAAIMAASNAAAQRGILVRDGVALERAGRVTAVLFDKTGTLTKGKPMVAEVLSLESNVQSPEPKVLSPEGTASSVVLRLAAGLARHSSHPISQAVAALSVDGAELSDWEEVGGGGVMGLVQSPSSSVKSTTEDQKSKVRSRARLGSLRWLGEAGVDLGAGKDFVAEWSAQGATMVGLAVEKSLLGLFAVKDAVKPGARPVVEQLQRQGLKVYLVTGDNPLTAASIAKQTGIAPANVFAEVRPEQKAELVRKLQQAGERVAFVGDGINDAPAIEQADLGIAVSRASDIAREAADIILLNSEIEAVPESLGLARAALRTIKQNLFWAFFYNALGVPLAALGFMSPILCAAAMGFSDLVVIGNALRLRRWRGR